MRLPAGRRENNTDDVVIICGPLVGGLETNSAENWRFLLGRSYGDGSHLSGFHLGGSHLGGFHVGRFGLGGPLLGGLEIWRIWRFLLGGLEVFDLGDWRPTLWRFWRFLLGRLETNPPEHLEMPLWGIREQPSDGFGDSSLAVWRSPNWQIGDQPSGRLEILPWRISPWRI
ncbi:hypothetical protein ACE6H2_000876 [Prunus campanulata]